MAGRLVDPSLRMATATSAWLTFSALGLPWPQLPASEPVRLTLVVEGLHAFACPAATMFPTDAPRCQYVVRGAAGRQQCCSRGLSQQWQGDTCGCSDDTSSQPWQLELTGAQRSRANSTFSFRVENTLPAALLQGPCASSGVDSIELELCEPLSTLWLCLMPAATRVLDCLLLW